MTIEAELPDGRILEFPDGTSPAVIQSVVKKLLAASREAPDTTVGGNIKEFFKGIIPGAAGMVESAGTGASALGSDATEKSVRGAVGDVAGTIKAPFTATPGYENSVGRKLGEGVGSFLPIAAIAAIPGVGVPAAAALATASGAGEARTRAEKEGATAEQKGTSTLLGAGVGALELAPVFKFLEKLSTPIKQGLFDYVRRAAVTGGVEGAQEAASQFLQNLIAKGIYKPDQELIEGTVESGLYGAGVGAIIQGVADMALGRRAGGGGSGGNNAPLPIEEARATAAAKVTTAPVAGEPVVRPPKPTLDTVQGTVLTPEVFSALGINNPNTWIRESLEGTDWSTDKEKVVKYFTKYISNPKVSEGRKAKISAFLERIGPVEPTAGAPAAPDASTGTAPAEQGKASVPPIQPTAIPETTLEEPTAVEPSTVMTPELFKELGIKNPSAGVRKSLEGKDWSNDEDRNTIIRRLQKYLENPKVSTENADRVSAFLTTLGPATIDPEIQAVIDRLKAMTEGVQSVPEPTLREEANNDTAIERTDGTGTEAAIAETGTAPNIPGMGVASEPPIQSTAVSPDSSAVELPESTAGETDGGTGGADVAVEPAETSDSLFTAISDLKAQRQALLSKNGRAPKEGSVKGKEWDRLNQEIDGLMGKWASLDSAERKVKGTPVATAKGTAPLDKNEDIQEIIEAVGIYNNPDLDKESPGKVKHAIDYVFDVANSKVASAARDAARSALKYMDSSLMRPEQQEKYDELVKDAKDDDSTWGQYSYNIGSIKFNTVPEQAEILKQIEGFTSPIEAANWLAMNSPSTVLSYMAGRVGDRLRALNRAGANLTFKVAFPGDPEYAKNGRAYVYTDLSTSPLKIDVVIKAGPTDGNNGLNYVTITHELIHAGASSAIEQVLKGGSNNQGLIDAVKSLGEVRIAVVKYLEGKQRRNEPLTSFEQEIVENRNNALKDSHELMAWGLSDYQMQEMLEGIPYQGGNTWKAFVTVVRRLLGLQPKIDTALSEVLRVSDVILGSNPHDQLEFFHYTYGAGKGYGPITNPAIASTPQTQQAAATIDAIMEPKRDSTLTRIRKTFAPLNLRQKLTDRDSPLDDLFTKWYAGRVRDTVGNLNPMVLLSRARDFLRVSKSVQEDGTLIRDPSGLFRAAELTIPADSQQFPLIAGQTISYKGLIERIANEAKANGKTYEAYAKELGSILYGHREHELVNVRGLTGYTPLLTPAKIAAAEAAFQSSLGLQEISQTLDAIRFSLIDAMVEAGRITPTKAGEYKDATGYIPFDRISKFEEKYSSSPNGANSGIAALRNRKSIDGSNQGVANPIEAFSGLVDWFVGESMKNDAAIKSLRDLQVMTLVRQVANPSAVSGTEPGKVISVYDQGVQTHFYVPDPAHAVSFDFSPANVSNVLRGLQKGSQILRAGVTAAPPFALKQVADDIIRAYVYSGVKDPLMLTSRILTNFPKLFFSEALGRNNPMIKPLTQLGVIGTFDFTESSNLKSILEEAGAKKRGLGANILRVMEAGAKASDLAVRKAIYDQVLTETGDVAAAESRAREIINFSRRGNSRMMDYMIRIVPFFNAYARGMDKLAVGMAGGTVGLSTGQARSLFWKRMSVLTAMGLTYAIMMQDDEEYNALQDHVRDRNWVLPYGKDLGFTPVIPIPAELAFIFKAIPERVVQYLKLQGTDEERAAISMIKDLLLQGVDVFSSPNVTPQLLKPLFENLANYSFFLGRPLESQSQVANMRPFERYGAGTSELAKSMGQGLENASNYTGIEALAISPIKIENMIRGLLGTTAGTVLAMTDAMMNPTRTDRPLHSMLAAQLTGASAFMKDGVGTRYLDEIYNIERKVEQTYGTYNRILASDPERAINFLQQNIGWYSARPLVRSYMERIKELNALAIRIDKMPEGISGQEKREMITDLKMSQVEIARDVFRLRKMIQETQDNSSE